MNKLLKKYPKLFDWIKLYREEYPNAPIYPIEFGIECGKGWYWLLDNLMDSITSYCKNNNKEFPKVVQIKEKFGGLRFYANDTDSNIDGMIWFAEDLSYNICENCGSTDNVEQTKGGWISTLCETCKK